MTELELALRQIKCGKSPGLDGVTNELLIHLTDTAKKVLLQHFNRSWREGVTPAAWRIAEIVAIPKKGKNAALLDSYRPMSLLSCISKPTMERMVQSRLLHFLETGVLLNNN